MKFAVFAVTLLFASCILDSVGSAESSEGLRARLAVRRGHLRGRSSEISNKEKANAEVNVGGAVGGGESENNLPESVDQGFSLMEKSAETQNGYGFNSLQMNNGGNPLNGGGVNGLTLLLMGLLGSALGNSGTNLLNGGGNLLNSGGNVLNSGGNALNSGGNILNSGGNALNSGGNILNSGGNVLNSGGNALNSGGNAVNSGGNPLNSLFTELQSELQAGTQAGFIGEHADSIAKGALKNNPLAGLLFLNLLNNAFNNGAAFAPTNTAALEVNADEAINEEQAVPAAEEIPTMVEASNEVSEAMPEAVPESMISSSSEVAQDSNINQFAM